MQTSLMDGPSCDDEWWAIIATPFGEIRRNKSGDDDDGKRIAASIASDDVSGCGGRGQMTVMEDKSEASKERGSMS